MLIIAPSPDHNINEFISRIRESDCDFLINSFLGWRAYHQNIMPLGFVYIRVTPEITAKKTGLSLEKTQKLYKNNENYFINKIALPKKLKNIPVLILNGNINFENDFSQFYTHLFSIKKFFQEIKDAQDKANGIYVERKKKHSGCGC